MPPPPTIMRALEPKSLLRRSVRRWFWAPPACSLVCSRLLKRPQSFVMSSAKGQLYSSSLDLARRLDLFSSQTPVDAHGRVNRVPGAAAEGMPWKELLRKFTKHNPHREGEPRLLHLAPLLGTTAVTVLRAALGRRVGTMGNKGKVRGGAQSVLESWEEAWGQALRRRGGRSSIVLCGRRNVRHQFYEASQVWGESGPPDGVGRVWGATGLGSPGRSSGGDLGLHLSARQFRSSVAWRSHVPELTRGAGTLESYHILSHLFRNKILISPSASSDGPSRCRRSNHPRPPLKSCTCRKIPPRPLPRLRHPLPFHFDPPLRSSQPRVGTPHPDRGSTGSPGRARGARRVHPARTRDRG